MKVLHAVDAELLARARATHRVEVANESALSVFY